MRFRVRIGMVGGRRNTIDIPLPRHHPPVLPPIIITILPHLAFFWMRQLWRHSDDHVKLEKGEVLLWRPLLLQHEGGEGRTNGWLLRLEEPLPPQMMRIHSCHKRLRLCSLL